jgi:hypothetical protein
MANFRFGSIAPMMNVFRLASLVGSPPTGQFRNNRQHPGKSVTKGSSRAVKHVMGDERDAEGRSGG